MKALIWLSLILLVGCDANAPYRNDLGQTCSEHKSGCGSFLEHHKNYDLGFIEFTERGNDFHPENTAKLMDEIKRYAQDPGVAVIVFVHGWKNNASTENDNVKQFQQTLALVSSPRVIANRRLIGIYIGWRGESLSGWGVKELTFWDRKAVAEEVGRRGVTSAFLDLRSAIGEKNNSLLLITGHSFGAAVTLSALQSTLMERMRVAENGGELKPFSDGVVLLNPAIEANQGLILKESSMRIGYLDKPQPTMMYVLSSRADYATNRLFPLGQNLGVNLTWSHTVLQRNYYGFKYALSETDLDNTTIGNYALFNTGYIKDQDPTQVEKLPPITVLSEENMPKLGKWEFISYCVPKDKLATLKNNFTDRLPCFDQDPINFISVPASFIASHNDVFNSHVNAFIVSVVLKARFYNFDGAMADRLKRVPAACRKGEQFDFEGCFNLYQPILEAMEQKNTQAN